MKRGYRLAAIEFICGCILGAAIWWLSPTVTGHAEPWDAEGWQGFGSYFCVALFIAGALAACVWPPGFAIGALGVYAGQLTFMLLSLESGPLLPLGIVMLAGYSVVALLGGAVTYGIYRLILALA